MSQCWWFIGWNQICKIFTRVRKKARTLCGLQKQGDEYIPSPVCSQWYYNVHCDWGYPCCGKNRIRAPNTGIKWFHKTSPFTKERIFPASIVSAISSSKLPRSPMDILLSILYIENTDFFSSSCLLKSNYSAHPERNECGHSDCGSLLGCVMVSMAWAPYHCFSE